MLNTESTKNNKVAIILATYNPNMLYLKQQLVSIRDQTFKDYHLYVFDDDSIKSNFKYIKNLLTSIFDDHFTLIMNSENIGCPHNFIQALKKISQHEYYSFCDQDDIWLPNKLQTSLAGIVGNNLYCSSTKLVDENNNFIGINELNIMPSFKNALVQSIAGGNTYLFDNHVKQLLLKIPDKISMPSHDWTLYQVTSAHNYKINYDHNPTILYRLHSNNLTGTSFSFKSKIMRLIALFSGEYKKWNDDNYKILSLYKLSMKPRCLKLLETFYSCRNGNIIHRISLYTKYSFRRSSIVQNLSFILGLIFNKI
tara:strand:- start:239 stop:1168 length:930 start_codon:yes stop_codon:yes gene_type:complete